MDQEEDRSRIGRCHDRAYQQRLDPAQIESVSGDRRSKHCGKQDPGRRQGHRRTENAAESREPGTQASVEQNERKRDRADDIGGAHVIELNAARARFAGNHADDEKHQE